MEQNRRGQKGNSEPVKKMYRKRETDFVNFLLKFSGLDNPTSAMATRTAVSEEKSSLAERTIHSISTLPENVQKALLTQAIIQELDAGVTSGTFPGDQLGKLFKQVENDVSLSSLAEVLACWLAKDIAFEERLQWLCAGTSYEKLQELDPIADADRISHELNSAFRFEAWVLNFLAISRIAVSSPVLSFFRSTREAEDNAAKRYYDTYSLFANFYEWGSDSKRGRATIERLNAIHGRYFIPNDAMKFVLLETAFTWLDGADRIGHRPLLDVEKRGFFHSHIAFGRRMNIDNINDNYDEMYVWYQNFCRANADFHPGKRDMFDILFEKSVVTAFPIFREPFRIAINVAMDESYRSAVGYPDGEKGSRTLFNADTAFQRF